MTPAVMRIAGTGVPPVHEARALALLLLVGFLLFVVFLFATLLIVRSARRFRRSLQVRRSPATPSDDVWAAHKPPQLDDDTHSA